MKKHSAVLAAMVLAVTAGVASAAGDAVAASTRPAAPESVKTALDAARDYFSMIKAELPRAAIVTYMDFGRFGERCFGEDWGKLGELERREASEALRAVMYVGFADPRVGELMSRATYDNFEEKPVAAAGGGGVETADVEFDMSGGPMPKTRNRLRFERIDGRWRLVDMWHNGQGAGEGIGRGYRQGGKQIGVLMFCRAMLDPRPAQPPQGQGGQGQQGGAK